MLRLEEPGYEGVDEGRLLGIYSTFEQAEEELKKVAKIFSEMEDFATALHETNNQEALFDFMESSMLPFWTEYPALAVKEMGINQNLYSKFFDSFNIKDLD